MGSREHEARVTITVRNAEPRDAEVLSVLATEVWLDTYALAGISPEFAAYVLRTASNAAYDHR